MIKSIIFLVLLLAITLNISYAGSNIELGIPRDKDNSDDYVMARMVGMDTMYVISYNKNLNVPNWVSWNLNADWYGDVDRYSGNFKTDTTLPTGFTRVKHSDYTNSGFDRGHLVRSEERTKTVEQNISTFFLTNIIPQTPDLNQGLWYSLEQYCEDLCKNQNKELFVIAGGFHYADSTCSGKGIVHIPDSCFKIVVILERGQGLKDVNKETPVISVAMPNIAGVRKDKWQKYVTTVRTLELSIGYNFLSNVQQEIQDVIENRVFTTDVEQETEPSKKLSCFPNPSNTLIKFDKPIENYALFDVYGVLVSEGRLSIEFGVSGLPNGLYWLKTNNNEITKVVIER